MTATSGLAAPRPRLALGLAVVGLAGSLVWFSLVGHRHLADPLLAALAVGAVGAELTRARYSSMVFVSASFACSMLAVAFLGAAPAFVLVVATDLVTWAVKRVRPAVLAINLVGVGLPSLAAAGAFGALTRGLPRTDARFELALALVAAGALALNFLLVSALLATLNGASVASSLRPPRELLPALAVNVALTVALAGVYAEFGLAASAFLIVVVIAFNYMAHLVSAARDRAREYASLSWGVLSGLVRMMQVRDPRAARHSAAVAAFSRDIAQQAGMGERECELVHTAGLLHDVGKFALSDRVTERGETLAEPDWQAVRRHPELGADMLRDLGLYGPVAEIVLGHHERLDGRGYPRGLRGDEIPELAKVVAVAEVYDTLSAEGTYRTRKNSFEALTELRRVSGSQLDARYVEALAALLAGRGTDYRHADEADFYEELDLERRINEAMR